MTSTAVDAACPRCGGATASRRGAEPWCPACEWNLDRYEPKRGAGVFGWQRLDRAHHRIAYRQNDRQYAALADRPLGRESAGAARIFTVAVGTVLFAVVVALFVGGIWLLVWRTGRGGWFFGPLMIAMAVLLRPRLGRLKHVLEEGRQVHRERCPELFALIEQVAAACGAPMPHVVLFGAQFNAFTTAAGLRRRRVLLIGGPLWASLQPQERVALLGHELGHFVNGDVRRGPVRGLALNVFAQLGHVFQPTNFAGDGSTLTMIAAVVAKPILWVISRCCFGLHLAMLLLGLRDAQRAEYYADDLAAEVAGSAAVTGMIDRLLVEEAVQTVVRREARAGNGAAAWFAAATTAVANLQPDLPLLRQLDRRDRGSLFLTHPPVGRRGDMLRHRPVRDGTVRLTPGAAERIDAELVAEYESARRELLHWYS